MNEQRTRGGGAVPGGRPGGMGGRPGGPGPGMGRGRGGFGGGGRGGPRGMMPGEKAVDFKGTMMQLINYLKPYIGKILLVWALAIFAAIFSIVGPKILGTATDEIISGFLRQISQTGGIDFSKIAKILTTMGVLYVISCACSYVQSYVMSGVTMKVTYNLRKNLYAKINRLPFDFYDKTTHGEVLSRITNDIENLSQSMNQSLTQMITSITTILSVIVMMLTISWQLTLVALVSVPLSFVFIMLIVRKSQKYFFAMQQYLGNVNGYIEEMFGAHIVVKAFCGEENSVREFKTMTDKMYTTAWKSSFLSGLMMPITGFVGNLAYVVVCIVGGYLAGAGSMTIGGIQSFIMYVRQFNQPISQVANISNVLQQTAAAAERVFEFLAEDEETADPVNAVDLVHGDAEAPEGVLRVKGEVEFKNVGFGYIEGEQVINNFNAHIEPGQKIAIVGPTGAGKTTIVKLLMRFYDVTEGSILVDGHDLRDFRRKDLRSIFGMVLQDTWLFSGTIEENIRYGRLDATDEEVRSAARAAQVDHFVRTLPGGYNLVLDEETSNISQGQKQLMTIARAILADPEILILDEATSSVDTRTEVLIQKAMDNLMRGRTSFIIAHRLSTIKNADIILVMNEGDIVEQGSHSELLAKGGFYAGLYNSQFDMVG